MGFPSFLKQLSEWSGLAAFRLHILHQHSVDGVLKVAGKGFPIGVFGQFSEENVIIPVIQNDLYDLSRIIVDPFGWAKG